MPLDVLLVASRPDLIRRYTAPDRHYHDLTHIKHCLALFEEHRHAFANPAAVEVAIWFHDAIYDPHRADNEEKSADLAAAALASHGTDDATFATVRNLILATKHNATPADPDAALLVDIDLAILGAAQPEFDAYEVAVRREYAHVPEPAFRTGRAAILERFLARSAIFTTPALHSRFEEPARRNLARSIAALRS